MDVKQLRARSAEDLGEELLKLRKEQFALRMQRASGQAVKPDQWGKVRRNIARVKTVLHEQKTGGVRKK
jgi:large subunit ribosomal protein L29